MNLDVSSMVDIPTVITLWAIGFAMKHLEWAPIKRISNKAIPMFLLVIGMLMVSVRLGDVTFNGLFIGFVSSMFAIGIHSSGKNIFSFFNDATLSVDSSSMNNGVVTQEKNKGTDHQYIDYTG